MKDAQCPEWICYSITNELWLRAGDVADSFHNAINTARYAAFEMQDGADPIDVARWEQDALLNLRLVIPEAFERAKDAIVSLDECLERIETPGTVWTGSCPPDLAAAVSRLKVVVEDWLVRMADGVNSGETDFLQALETIQPCVNALKMIAERLRNLPAVKSAAVEVARSRLRKAPKLDGVGSTDGEPALAPKERKALEYIRANPGALGKNVAKHVGITEETFRKHYVPRLKAHGVVNAGDGYRAASNGDAV